AADPAGVRAREPASSAAADLPPLQLARMGHDRVRASGRGLQLRRAAAPALVAAPGHVHLRLGRARAGYRRRVEPARRRIARRYQRHAARGIYRAIRQRGLAAPVSPAEGPVTTKTLAWNATRVGDPITPMRMAVSATVVVAGAIATRDFMPVHHDRDYANSQGSPNIFLNIMTDNGYCSRFLTDWAGPEAMVRKIAIRLGVPAYAGSVLEYAGTVTGTSQLAG